MATLKRTVTNLKASAVTITIPGYNPLSPIVLAPSVSTDLLNLVSLEQLAALQPTLDALLSRGSISVQATVDSAVIGWDDLAASSGDVSNKADKVDQVTEADAVASAATDAAVSAAADAVDAAGDPPTAAEFNAVVALANDLKAKYNASVALANDMKAKYNAAVDLLNEVKAKLDDMND